MYKEIDINFVLYHCIQGELISLCYADKVHYDDNYNAFICHGIERVTPQLLLWFRCSLCTCHVLTYMYMYM